MSHGLIHLWGPISIQSFGLIITIGLLLFSWLLHRHKKRKQLLSDDQFSEILLIGIVSGIIGGRLLFVAQEYQSMTGILDMLSFWQGGFSILGTIVFVLLALTIYLKRTNIPMLPFLDLLALYAPLLQSISRIGCYVAGCCYGMPTTLPWAVMYTSAHSLAPICVRMHPTQLYSSMTLLCIFFFMRFIAIKLCNRPGQLITLYLILASVERFSIDFWRADRLFFKATAFSVFSVQQWLALCIGSTALGGFTWLTMRTRSNKHESF